MQQQQLRAVHSSSSSVTPVVATWTRPTPDRDETWTRPSYVPSPGQSPAFTPAPREDQPLYAPSRPEFQPAERPEQGKELPKGPDMPGACLCVRVGGIKQRLSRLQLVLAVHMEPAAVLNGQHRVQRAPPTRVAPCALLPCCLHDVERRPDPIPAGNPKEKPPAGEPQTEAPPAGPKEK
jgi:hypothetical protein